jgi:hypothetical protein
VIDYQQLKNMKKENIRNLLDEFAEGSIILDGFDDAIIGITEEFGKEPRILYSKDKILEILTSDNQMDILEAIEYYEFNILGSYLGERTPIFLDKTITEMEDEMSYFNND